MKNAEFMYFVAVFSQFQKQMRYLLLIQTFTN